MGSTKVSEEKLALMLARPAVLTLPVQAYGPHPIVWADEAPPVWVWISWAAAPAERIPGYAKGWNDRVVIVEWNGSGGLRSTTVWRNAVTKRQ